MTGRSIDRVAAQLRDLVMEDREERLARHCMAVTQALLTCPEHLKGVTFKCHGDIVLAAHKFILGVQTPYYRHTLYKEGVMNIDANSLMNKQYPFWASPACFRYLMQYLYTGVIPELEEPGTSIDSHRDVVFELLGFALQPRKAGLGGVDKYLIEKLCVGRPRTIKDAMLRLTKGMTFSIQEIVDAMREVIPTLPFARDCFNVAHLNSAVVELVLRDVPLAASELDVCRAVYAWAQEFFGMDSDDEDESGDDTSNEALLLLPSDDQRILQHIDLRYVNASELREFIAPMRLFPRKAIIDALRAHALNKTGALESRPNPNRGRSRAGGHTEISMPPK
eukprot:jgi/Ulvmu1/11297/UM074_0012.1